MERAARLRAETLAAESARRMEAARRDVERRADVAEASLAAELARRLEAEQRLAASQLAMVSPERARVLQIGKST